MTHSGYISVLVLIIVHKFVTEVLVWLLGLQVDYPEIAEGIAPRHRFMSAYEQRIEPPDKSWQYLLFAAEPYETIAFKVCHFSSFTIITMSLVSMRYCAFIYI